MHPSNLLKPWAKRQVGDRFSKLALCTCILSIGLLLSFSACQQDEGIDGQQGPNVILLLVDDLRWDEPGYTGYPVSTPNIDRLAANGIRFNNAYVTSSICSPSRASFITGLYPHSHGVVGNTTDLDYDNTPTIATLLKKAGYTTAMIGKWHMGQSSEPRPGYDRWFALPGQGQYRNPRFNDNGRTVEVAGYNTDILTEKAIAFIAKNRKKPFFLHLGYKAVHYPFEPAPRHRQTLSQADFDSARRPNSAATNPVLRQKRGETLLSVDDSVGEIYAFLKENNMLENTILVFTSDNGFLLGEHNRGDKRVFYEESIRIPWLLHYPRLRLSGSSISEQILNVDFVPTILDLVGINIPTYVQGISFLSLIDGGKDDLTRWRDYWVYEYFNEEQYMHVPTHLAVVSERYKYVTFPEGPDLFNIFTGEDLLFDLKHDPYELENLADSDDHTIIKKTMREQLSEFARRYEFRYFPLDSDKVNDRIEFLYNDKEHSWFKRLMDKNYPNGYPGWQSPSPRPLH